MGTNRASAPCCVLRQTFLHNHKLALCLCAKIFLWPTFPLSRTVDGLALLAYNLAMIQKVTNYLQQIGASYQLIRHPAVVTTEESRQIIHVQNCASCKSLYVKDKKSDNFYLVVLPFDKRAEMRKLASYVGCAKFEFATEEKLFADLGVHRGSVSPFAFLNENPQKPCPLLLDRQILTFPSVKFHPCDNTATVVMPTQDFLKFLQSIGKQTILVDD